MSSIKETKIRRLLRIWPRHTLAPTKWLVAQGYSADLVKRYVTSGWFERKARGVIMHTNDTVDWRGAAWGVQKTSLAVVGGKSAFELLGMSHYVNQEESNVFLFLKTGDKPPKWSLQISETLQPTFILTNLFAPDVCIQNKEFADYSLVISNPARAMCEYLYLMENHHTASEAYHLMENINSLSPEIVQTALEKCNSIKVKRLFLCLSKRVQTNWYARLDLNKIDIGRGKRHLKMVDIAFDSEFEMAFPIDWNKKGEDESLF